MFLKEIVATTTLVPIIVVVMLYCFYLLSQRSLFTARTIYEKLYNLAAFHLDIYYPNLQIQISLFYNII